MGEVPLWFGIVVRSVLPAVNRGNNGRERSVQPVQTFGVSHEEVPVGRKKAGKAAQGALAAAGVKIDQNVSAKNQVELADQGIGRVIEIETEELDDGADFGSRIHLASL